MRRRFLFKNEAFIRLISDADHGFPKLLGGAFQQKPQNEPSRDNFENQRS